MKRLFAIPLVAFASLGFLELMPLPAHAAAHSRSVSDSVSGSPRCRQVLQLPQLEHILKPGYVERYLTEKNTNKVIEVPNQVPIQDQGNLGFCFLYSWIEQAAHNYKIRNNGEDPNVSISYLAYHHWLARAIKAATDVTAPISISEGGTFDHVVNLVRDHGMLSEDQWVQFGGKPMVDLSNKDFIEKGQLKALVVSAHIEKNLLLKILEPQIPRNKTYADYFTSLMNDVPTKNLLEQFVLKKQRALLANKTNLSRQQVTILSQFLKGQVPRNSLSADEKQKMIYNLNLDITHEIKREFNVIFFGLESNPLESLDFAGPKTFAAKVVPELSKKTITLVTTGERKSLTTWAEQELDHFHLQASFETILNTLKTRVDEGKTTYISYDHQSYYVSTLTGAMTIEGISHSPFNPYLDRATRKWAKVSRDGHATQIVGYELDSDGKIIALKMQNSWGPKYGKLGYFRMDMSYFRAFVDAISFQDENNMFSDETLKTLKALKEAKK